MLDQQTSQKPISLQHARAHSQTHIGKEGRDARQLRIAQHRPPACPPDGVHRKVFEVVAPLRHLQRQLGLVARLSRSAIST